MTEENSDIHSEVEVRGNFSEELRPATAADVSEIWALLEPNLASGRVLSLTEDTVRRDIGDYFVVTVNRRVVVTLKLNDYGSAVELAKFCALPEFKRRGRATRLVEHAIDIARERGKQAIFALSVDPVLWSYFEKLGFSEVDRQSLPDAWQRQYNMSRPSKAFLINLASPSL